MEHAGSLEALGSQLEKFISTKTVFGEPVVAGKVTLIPIQSVSLVWLRRRPGKTERTQAEVQVQAAGQLFGPWQSLRLRKTEMFRSTLLKAGG